MLLENESPILATEILRSWYADWLGDDGMEDGRVEMAASAKREMAKRRTVSRRAVKRGIGRPKRVCCLGIVDWYLLSR